ncbi:Intraflagellar transport protein 140 [Nymphon striatum]|nr:Intraflagellar transport protein 140 [Nymphon striatum]
MAVYFDQLISGDPSSSDHSVKTHVAWHSIYPVLAVSVFSSKTGGAVQLYNDQGKTLGSEIKPLHEPSEEEVEEPWWSSASALAWHPLKRFLAIAWEKGDIDIWNDHDAVLQKCSDQRHKDAVHVLHWSKLGNRVMSADNYGSCVAWKVDQEGNMSVVFHHDLKESISQLVFKFFSNEDHREIHKEIRKVAKAAVGGDNKALDMFVTSGMASSTAANNEKNLRKVNEDCLDCYVGSAAGNIYHINSNGSCSEVAQNTLSVYKMFYFSDFNVLVVVTTGLQLCTYQCGPDGSLQESSKIKVMSKCADPEFSICGKGMLAMTCGEEMIRIFNVSTKDSYILSLNKTPAPGQFNEVITSLAYAEKSATLAAGTNLGTVLTWQHTCLKAGIERDSEDQWKVQTPANIRGVIKQLEWGLENKCLVANTQQQIYILHQHLLCKHFNNLVACVQTSANDLTIDIFSNDNIARTRFEAQGTLHHRFDLKTEIQIHGIFVSTHYIAMESLDLSNLIIFFSSIGSFKSSSRFLAINEQSVFTVDKNKILVTTTQGTIKQALPCSDEEGQPISLDICRNVLVCGTTEGYIKTWDLSRRQDLCIYHFISSFFFFFLCFTEVKPHAHSKSVLEFVKKFKGFHSVKINCNGTKISFIIYTTENKDEPDSKLYVWDLEGDLVRYFDFKIGKSDDDISISSENEDLTPAEKLRLQASREINGRFPTAQFWDPEEPRILVCEASILENLKQSKSSISVLKSSNKVKKKIPEHVPCQEKSIAVSLFVTTEHGIMIQDHFPMDEDESEIIGIRVPYYYIYSKDLENKESAEDAQLNKTNKEETGRKDSMKTLANDIPNFSNHVKSKSMRDFVGLEMCDDVTKDAMINFCFFLTVGNMDEAFKAIKAIRSENVWENMAKMCVKTKRLDVASVCLGKMGHAHGAKALRQALANIPEEDARVAVLAVHLGMLDEAEKFYKSCGRYDLLNKLYQDSNQWEKALDIAENQDRINLRTTFYNYAKHLESIGNARAAITFYESSETQHFEVPRMLLDDPDALDDYIERSKDRYRIISAVVIDSIINISNEVGYSIIKQLIFCRKLWKWWAQYMESTGEMETALRYYEAAQDHLSLVRVYCYLNNLEKAADIANDSGDKLACFHLGRQHENNGNINEAIHFFARAHAYSNAVRLCKENDLEDQVLNLALMCGPEGMIDAARYYEVKEGYQDKAVMLYHKAGYLNKAVELAFRVKQFSVLQHIANDLDEKADPQLLMKCADFFIANGHFDRAVDLLSIAKKYIEALDLCVKYHVEMTEKLAERLTPPKDDKDQGLRLRVLEKIAECAIEQDNYHLATKKFTQAGNRIQAMKSLLKSGDTEKIVFFAGVSRQKEIYVMAANYLQSLDWKKDPDIMKNIITFYTKGRVPELLSSFYNACAQVEIDDYQNYEKALGALNEAFKCISKASQTTQDLDQKISESKMKIELVRQYVQATRLYDEDPDEAMKMCKLLLQEEMLELGVRSGDVYGFMAEHYAKIKNFQVNTSI